ncbi:DUF3179 domain-containing protein [Nitrososphaera viennensis]|uniref:DUF3179 domain-containing protein n=1 Tax=Nitrososphaera viennensis TaxID=1034015 RepID=A0A977NNF3_9ARCH|nr:DUF3179 domain-containing protein [Nitrososphaera viennensis]UVS70382.1 DUF3179 domain-containing protein [Nitrososphaera viennensis]
MQQRRLGYMERNALAKSLLAGGITMSLYLLVVVLTTPSLPALSAIQAAFSANPVVIGGTSMAVAAQTLFASYGRSLGCNLEKRSSRFSAGSGSAVGSFFSFFSLVPLGCCGSWLLLLSFLPSVFGTAVSAFLVDYSKPLSYVATASVLGLAALNGVKLYRRISKMAPRPPAGIVKPLAILVGSIVLSVVVIASAAAAIYQQQLLSNDATAAATDDRPAAFLMVPPDKIVNGGPPRDGIPSIDNPKFVSVKDAKLEDSDLVLGLEINGDIRAYPLRIMVWHEVVNDHVGGVPVAVTYCPLCFTNQVFKRTVGDAVVEFGTSGKLYNSNLVMYDRTSESLWSQALGQGIAGKYAGVKLERVPFDLAYWKDWKELHLQSKVLSQDTGYGRPYGSDPYGDYYTSPDILFPVSHRDDRLGSKEIVIGLENSGTFKAYKLQDVEDKHVINDEIDAKPVALFSVYSFGARLFDRTLLDDDDNDGDGKVVLDFRYQDGKIMDAQTSSVWDFDGRAIEGPLKGKQLSRLPFDEGFWFEWAAFHPETELHS